MKKQQPTSGAIHGIFSGCGRQTNKIGHHQGTCDLETQS